MCLECEVVCEKELMRAEFLVCEKELMRAEYEMEIGKQYPRGHRSL